MKTRRRILIALYLAVVCAPIAAKLLHAKEHEIEGSFAPAERPSLTFAGVTSEDYQTKLTAWFEASLGLRGWATWIDNTFLYKVFNETKWGSHVAIGFDRFLFERDDINYFNRSGDALPKPGAVDHFADDIAALQARLAREHRALVPLFLPSKTTFYRDEVPDRWTRDLGDPRPAETAAYRALKTALDARHVTFVDGIDLLASSKEPKSYLWGRDARHFSALAGCTCMAAVMTKFAAITGRAPVDYPCIDKSMVSKHSHSDLDLFRLLNAWGVKPVKRVHEVQHDPITKPANAPNALWISTSFGWMLEIDAVQSNLFGELHLDYYNNVLYQDGHEGSIPVEPHTPAWRAVFLTRDLVVLELHESYLTPGSFFGENAVSAMLQDLGR